MIKGKGYDSIIGYREIKAMLRIAARNQSGAGSYIFSGEKGCGKGTVAEIFAMSLLCDKQTGEACMECPSCKKALAGNNPDIITVTHEKPDSVGIDDIRRKLIDDIYIRPFEKEKKIYIVPDASLMTVQAQNALLKTLEEPPEYAVIILLADNMQMLLPTIVSRCNTITFNALSDEVVRKYLKENYQISDDYNKIYAALSMGRIGTAIKLAESSEFYEKMQEGIQILKKSKGMDNFERIELTKKLAVNKKEIFDYLDIFMIWFRDVLYFKATKETESIIFKEERAFILKRAQVSSYEGIQKILDGIETAKTRIKANVNPELVLELLLLTISEN